jgi:lipopolysaccharide/colanic/teichoic acid biosynthesis glycosyltransferase
VQSQTAPEATYIQGSSLAASRRRRRYPLTLSRVTDVALALLLIVATLPVMLGIALAVKLQDGGPVLFGHMRIGYGGRCFRCWKFRSMVVDADVRLSTLLASDEAAQVEWTADHKLRRDPRVTALGRRLRVTSLDELPQLFNVVTGEMSLVGPRPIVAAEAARYGRWFSRYCAVKPGLTGLWQISGRNDVDYRTRVALDVLYARRRSFALYFWILAGTIPAVLMRRGSY